MRHTGNRIEGSNPSLSAILIRNNLITNDIFHRPRNYPKFCPNTFFHRKSRPSANRQLTQQRNEPTPSRAGLELGSESNESHVESRRSNLRLVCLALDMRFVKSTASVKSLLPASTCSIVDVSPAMTRPRDVLARRAWTVTGCAIASGSHILSSIKRSAVPDDGREV